ncbi:MAG TPA: class D sortase [Candidatus Binatia bacterium]|nr:class D sortase [Candidatus Binatia bacterium]
MQARIRSKTLHRIELALLIVGVLLIGVFIAAHIHRTVLSRAAVARFEALNTERPADDLGRTSLDRRFKFDFTLWDEKRVQAYEHSLAQHFDPPLAVLRIAKVHLEVPVLDGVDDLTLNRGVGYIPGTSAPGDAGNIGIAGHRDGFFRVLKDVSSGDMIELETAEQISIYRVDQIVIVDKHDASVLRPTPVPSLTLVTCYPFYYIGSAPKRYIVIASLVESGRPGSVENAPGTKSAHSEPVPQNSNPQSQPSTKEITR